MKATKAACRVVATDAGDVVDDRIVEILDGGVAITAGSLPAPPRTRTAGPFAGPTPDAERVDASGAFEVMEIQGFLGKEPRRQTRTGKSVCFRLLGK